MRTMKFYLCHNKLCISNKRHLVFSIFIIQLINTTRLSLLKFCGNYINISIFFPIIQCGI